MRDVGAANALEHVYWIGGGSGAGKSTITRRLAAAYGMRTYLTDDVLRDHHRRSTAEDSPFLAEFAAMGMDDRWLNRSPETMLETFHWFRGEGFELIVDDLRSLPSGPPVIADGFRLLPHLVEPLLTRPQQAVWLIPTPEFRRAAFDHRGSLWTIANRTTNPGKALRNLLERDRMFTERVRRAATGLGLTVIDVDIPMTEDELASEVAHSFGFPYPNR